MESITARLGGIQRRNQDQIRKGKAPVELYLSEGNKKNFCRYVGDKSKSREIVDPLWKKMGVPGHGEC